MNGAEADKGNGDRRRFERDPLTLLCFAAIGVFGFLQNGLGPILPFLQVELSLGRGQVGTFSLLLAFGLLTIGFSGHHVVELIGRRMAFWAGLVGLTSGALILAATTVPPIVATGVAIMGLGGAMLVFLVPAILSDRHGHLATQAIVESTGSVSASAILAPLLISLAVTLGLGWRAGYVVLPLVVAIIVLLVGRRIPFEGDHLVPSSRTMVAVVDHRPDSYRRRWFDVLIVVSVEMCMVFWSADYLVSVLHVDSATAAAIVSLFFIGMAIGRIGGGRFGGSRWLFIRALLVSSVGFAVFWLAPNGAIAGVGLLVTGLGVALLYPLSISRALTAWPDDPDRASARGALASGLAFGVAPFALAIIAENAGLRLAFLVVPLLLIMVIVNTVVPTRIPAATVGRPAA